MQKAPLGQIAGVLEGQEAPPCEDDEASPFATAALGLGAYERALLFVLLLFVLLPFVLLPLVLVFVRLPADGLLLSAAAGTDSASEAALASDCSPAFCTSVIPSGAFPATMLTTSWRSVPAPFVYESRYPLTSTF